MRRLSFALVLCASLCSGTTHAVSSIGVFADAAATDCDITILAFTQFTMYVIAQPFGDEAAVCGVLRADLRVTGMPAEWFVTASPNPSGSAAGNILGGGGSIDFLTCLPPGDILLYTLSGFAITSVSQVLIRPESRIDVMDVCSPSGRPTLRVCDQSSTPICAFPQPLFVNYPCCPCGVAKPVSVLAPRASGTCLVAVEPQTWGTVKGFYKD